MPETGRTPGTDAAGAEAFPPACAAVRAALLMRSDGERPRPSESGTLDAHLADCPACADELRRATEFTSEISDLLAGLKPPADLRRKVLDRIETAAPRARLLVGAAALAAALAAGLVVLALGGEEPLAEVTGVRGGVTVHARSGGGPPRPAGPAPLRSGERLELAPGGRAALVIPCGKIDLAGPALVQVERGPGGRTVVHVLRESHLSAEVTGPGLLEVRMAAVLVRTNGARLALDVDRTGGARIGVEAGRVAVTDAAGERTLVAGSTASLRQPGAR